ncbi:SDR family oxidoreductase [Futiania mangrovi]|uniref:SDR family oxidoreductase n=1 Tax=Futiania mangrovi TaxID=2959716 RepID=A0A9J6PL79_9PROT|nr:SDR family oxidoreductase [Futiania mangrovii]MCP1337375.1 SDR family oxidoreductase [Futiania mangrovii]
MDLGLEGKRVLVTGGSKGIGLACARAFLTEGAKVGIVSRSQANVDTALADLPGAVGHAADLTDAAAALDTVQAMEEKLGPLDVLVNSAGAAKRTPAPELTPEAWRGAMDAKFFSYINVIDPLIKLMAARGKGVVVNVIGNGGKVASPTHLAGGAANAALMLATAGLGSAYAASGVRVLAVSPGLTNTGRVAQGLASEARLQGITVEEAGARAVARIPMGRWAEPEEIANAVLFLASEKASYLTGVSIPMDGASVPVVI